MIPADEDPLTGGSPAEIRTPAEVRRFLRSLPAHCVHSWRSSTRGFKLCAFLSTTLLFLLTLSITAQVRQSPTAATTVVWKTLPRPSKSNVTQTIGPPPPHDPNFVARRRAECTTQDPCFVQLIADLDTNSRVGTDLKPSYMSKLLTGRFTFDGNEPEFEWFLDGPLNVIGRMAEEGRGMELSELVLFNDTMFSFDDRTGIVFELMAKSKEEGSLRGGQRQQALASLLKPMRQALKADVETSLKSIELQPVARTVLTEGDGTSPKGMKIEWACEKNNELYVGSFGKEYTTPDGSEVVSTANLWVSVIEDTTTMHHRREDWAPFYAQLRTATDSSFPGYLIHEAVNWSPYYRKWFFLPRRVSSQPYNEQADEKRGSNKILIASEDFEDIHVVEVKFPVKAPERGFSSFKFVPGTKDKYIIGLRSAEDEAAGTQSTYLSVFSNEGKMVTDEILISGSIKYEGLEIW